MPQYESMKFPKYEYREYPKMVMRKDGTSVKVENKHEELRVIAEDPSKVDDHPLAKENQELVTLIQETKNASADEIAARDQEIAELKAKLAQAEAGSQAAAAAAKPEAPKGTGLPVTPPPGVAQGGGAGSPTVTIKDPPAKV